MPGQQRGMGGVASTRHAKLTMADAKARRGAGPRRSRPCSPRSTRRLQVQYLNQNTSTSIVGTTANYLEVRKYELDAGRMFTRAEDEGKQRLVVLGPDGARRTSASASPDAIIGESVRIKGIQFTVIGVLKSKGQTSPFGNPDDQVLDPDHHGALPRVRHRPPALDQRARASRRTRFPTRWPRSRRCSAASIACVARRPDDFQIRNQADFLNTLGETTAVFTYLLAASPRCRCSSAASAS